jgi:glycosyltransferase involved in cell wall biosynthesis
MLTILESFKKKGHKILVLLPSNGPITHEFKRLDIDYKVIRFFSSYLYLKILYKHLLVPALFFYNFLALPKLLKATKDFNPDVIYSNTSAENAGVIISKILKIKHVSHIREFMSLDHGSYFWLGRKNKQKFIDMSDGVIFVSEAVASHVLLGKAKDDDKHQVIFNGINNKQESLPPKKLPVIIKFGLVGVLQASKGHSLAIDYFNEYVKINPNAQLHIFGEGYPSYEKMLKKKIKNYALEDKIILHGFVKNTDEIYESIDILLMFSRSEGFGRVTAEAMFKGVPVIGLNQGGTTELIRNGQTGFLVTDYASFENAAKLLVSSNESYNTIRNNAFNEAKKLFSIEKYTNSVETFILNIINK